MTTALDLISTHQFLAGLPPAALEHLSVWARRTPVRAGTALFSEGGKADKFWLIRDGHVQLDLYVPGPGSVVVESLTGGTVLGWSWLFPPYRWQFSATAVTPTLTVEFDGAGVRRLCEQDPALGYELMQRFTRVVIDRLQATRMRLLDLYRAP
jgi:CRP/FNR family cyclic AMP-dependent transcriptional regulator